MKKKLIFIGAIFLLIVIAGVILINMRFPVRYLDIIRENAGELEPSLILAVIMAESSFREGAESHAGAQGLMQIMPATAEDIAVRMGMVDFQPEDIWLPEINIAMGSFYLNRLFEMFGCVELALAAYNAGQGNVRRYGGVPPFEETNNYLRRVRRNQRVYNIILAVTGRR